MHIRKLTTASLLIALGVVTAHVVSIPVGVARAFPMQHAINVMAAALLGTPMAILIAFLISLLRFLLGTGSLLAFPGSLFGAGLAGLLYAKTRKKGMALAGEVVGTTFLGGLSAVPIARLFLGFGGAAGYFLLPFGLSSIMGAFIGYAILRLLQRIDEPNKVTKGGPYETCTDDRRVR